MKKILTLAIFFVKNDRNIETVKNTICIFSLVLVLLVTLSSCSSDSEDTSNCLTVTEKTVNKNYSPSKLYITLSDGQIYSVSYTKYTSVNIGDSACNGMSFN